MMASLTITKADGTSYTLSLVTSLRVVMDKGVIDVPVPGSDASSQSSGSVIMSLGGTKRILHATAIIKGATLEDTINSFINLYNFLSGIGLGASITITVSPWVTSTNTTWQDVSAVFMKATFSQSVRDSITIVKVDLEFAIGVLLG